MTAPGEDMLEMGKPAWSVSLTDREKEIFEELARRAYPDAERGAQARLFRKWLYEAAERAEIELTDDDKTRYGGLFGDRVK